MYAIYERIFLSTQSTSRSDSLPHPALPLLRGENGIQAAGKQLDMTQFLPPYWNIALMN